MDKFEMRAKAHVRKVFRVRHKLIAENKGSHTSMMLLTLEKVEALFNFYPYNTDRKMAMFITNHSAELAYLTPGIKSSSHESMMKELNDLIGEATTIICKHNEPAVC